MGRGQQEGLAGANTKAILIDLNVSLDCNRRFRIDLNVSLGGNRRFRRWWDGSGFWALLDSRWLPFYVRWRFAIAP
jgi:hypothetical protein